MPLPTALRALLLVAASGLLGVGLTTAARAAPNPQALLVASDAVRNPGQPFTVNVQITEFSAGKKVDSNQLVTYSRTLTEGAQFASLVLFVQPTRDAGKLMLKSGNDLWFFDPSTKASVRLSPQQRLIGQASNGDVVTVNLARDYKATLAAEEQVQDGERKTRTAYKLMLTASTEEATYGSIELWIDAGNSQPIKGHFFAGSDRLLKTVFYRRYEPQLGMRRPTELVIIDGLDPQSVTLMRLSDYRVKDIPANWFQRDYLPRFQPE